MSGDDDTARPVPEPPVGFALYRTVASAEAYEGVELLLPIALRWRLLEERRAAARAREEERRAAAIARAQPDREKSIPASAFIANQLSVAASRRAFAVQFERGVLRRNPARFHPVLEAEEVLRVLDKVFTVRNKDDHRRELELVEKIKGLGALREVANPARSPARWGRALSELRSTHPHFLEVTEFVAGQVTVSTRSRKALAISPIHLWGPPGIGKSHYANDLAVALGAPLRRHSMVNAQTTSLLLGTERHWSTATPGAIFDQIVLGRYANPMVLLDEIDKVSRGSSYDPLAPLHLLLEPLTATTARDAALDMTFDASLAFYVATSNDPRKIPDSIRDRFTEFEIHAPRGEHALQVARIVAGQVIVQLGLPNFSAPEPKLAHRLAHLPARSIRKAVQFAVGRAMVNERRYLTESDLPPDVLDDSVSKPILH